MIGGLYASQMVRSSVRARVRFRHLGMLWSHLEYFVWCLVDLRDLEVIRWANSGLSCLEVVFEIFMCCVVSDVTLGNHHSLQSLHGLFSRRVEDFVSITLYRSNTRLFLTKLVILIGEIVKSALSSVLPAALQKMAHYLFQSWFGLFQGAHPWWLTS